MTLDFPTRLRWTWCETLRVFAASLGHLRELAVLDCGGGWWRYGVTGGDLRTAILAAEDEAIDLLCGALASLKEPA